MEVMVHSTERIVAIEAPGGAGQIQARVWEGQTDSGIPVVMLVARVAAPLEVAGEPVDHSTFQAELQEHAAPSARALQAFPLRLVL